jgi:hypothetical protein
VEILVQALGLPAATGINPYLTLLLLVFAAHSGAVPDPEALAAAYPVTEEPWFVPALAVLFVVDQVVDKIPGLDHISDAVHTVVKPVLGAFLAVALLGQGDGEGASTALAAGLGGGAALTTHGAKAGLRVASSSLTLGLGNWFVSLVEDVAVVVLVLALLLVPILGALLLLAMLAAVVATWRWLRRRSRDAAEAEGPGPTPQGAPGG